jgi:hypothetical protein
LTVQIAFWFAERQWAYLVDVECEFSEPNTEFLYKSMLRTGNTHITSRERSDYLPPHFIFSIAGNTINIGVNVSGQSLHIRIRAFLQCRRFRISHTQPNQLITDGQAIDE